MKFELSEKERNTLKEMIDIAVKAGGMRVAEAGVFLTRKLDSPLPEPEVVKVESKDKDTVKE